MDKHISEHELNPAPYKYKVSNVTKILFMMLFIVGVFGYFYMIVDRRVSQKKFIMGNHMAAVRLSPAPMPAMPIVDPMTGQAADLAAHIGQWTLLNIWATWCPPCREEMPSLELLHQKLGHKIKIIALSVDDKAQTVAEFIKTNKPSFSVLHDQDHLSPKLFGVNKYPETFLISPAGVLTIQLSGPRDWSSMQALNYLESIIK